MYEKEILNQNYVILTKKKQQNCSLYGLILESENDGDNVLRKVG